MKTVKLRQYIKEYLEENGPKSSEEIRCHINRRTRHGTTSQQLGNILAKDPDIRKTGLVKVKSQLNSSYEICVWELIP